MAASGKVTAAARARPSARRWSGWSPAPARSFGSVPGFFIGTVITGIGFGGGFQGAIRSVMPLAAPHQRAGMLSVVYVISYLAMGLPAVIAGFLLVHEGDLLATAVQYGAAVMVLAALALLGVARPARLAEAVPAARQTGVAEGASAVRSAAGGGAGGWPRTAQPGPGQPGRPR